MLCLICQDGMWCIGLAPDAWNLSGRCQATQDAQDAGDADSTSRVSGRNSAVSDAGYFFADEELILQLHWEGARWLIAPGGPPVDQFGLGNGEGDVDWGCLSLERREGFMKDANIGPIRR